MSRSSNLSDISSRRLIRDSTAEFLIFTAQESEASIEARYEDETIWLTQRLMAELFGTTRVNVALHLRNIYDSGELEESATCKDFLHVRQEGQRQVNRRVAHYNLDAIISVGYRVNSVRATQFRQCATGVLRDFAIRGHTAAELIDSRADADQPHMGLTTWAGSPDGKILRSDVTVAKNYLTRDELNDLGRLVNVFLEAERLTRGDDINRDYVNIVFVWSESFYRAGVWIIRSSLSEHLSIVRKVDDVYDSISILMFEDITCLIFFNRQQIKYWRLYINYGVFSSRIHCSTAIIWWLPQTATGSWTAHSPILSSWTKFWLHGCGKPSCSSWTTSSSVSTTTIKPSTFASGCHDRRWSGSGRSRRFLVVMPAKHWQRRERMHRV